FRSSDCVGVHLDGQEEYSTSSLRHTTTKSITDFVGLVDDGDGSSGKDGSAFSLGTVRQGRSSRCWCRIRKDRSGRCRCISVTTGVGHGSGHEEANKDDLLGFQKEVGAELWWFGRLLW
ncbi:unnamed protein product, partial [Allacma fusca]